MIGAATIEAARTSSVVKIEGADANATGKLE